MKVLFVVSGLSVGGAETMLHQLLSFLKKEKFKTFVICLSKEGKIGKLMEEMGINVCYLDIK